MSVSRGTLFLAPQHRGYSHRHYTSQQSSGTAMCPQICHIKYTVADIKFWTPIGKIYILFPLR